MHSQIAMCQTHEYMQLHIHVGFFIHVLLQLSVEIATHLNTHVHTDVTTHIYTGAKWVWCPEFAVVVARVTEHAPVAADRVNKDLFAVVRTTGCQM